MNFDNIAETQVFEGNTIDVIFPKKRQARKRKSFNPDRDSIAFTARPEATQQSQDLNKSETQKTDSPEDLFFTNENIFRHNATTSSLFQKYFPPEVLRFTDEELAEINDLYSSLQEEQVNEQCLLTERNVNELEKSSLIERFLRDTEVRNSSQGSSSSIPSFLIDSNSPVISTPPE